MSKFVVDFSKWQDKQLPWPTEEQFRVALLTYNHEATWFQDINNTFGVECKHKPLDIPECGVYWIELG